MEARSIHSTGQDLTLPARFGLAVLRGAVAEQEP